MADGTRDEDADPTPEGRGRPEVSAAEVDRRFADMVAGFGPITTPDEVSEAETSSERPTPAPPEPAAKDEPGAQTPEQPYTSEWRAAQRPDAEEDDHFVPEPPPPLPAGDLSFWTIVGGLVIGPVLIVLSLVLPVLSNDLWIWIGVAATVAGFVTLIRRPPGGHGPDRGARV
ncbi:hypothetical protein K0651_10720 [Ornithinimicrobium sp. Arc0846-15]|nr:hypothetical protein [Ornithinimicrobium laminariae]